MGDYVKKKSISEDLIKSMPYSHTIVLTLDFCIFFAFTGMPIIMFSPEFENNTDSKGNHKGKIMKSTFHECTITIYVEWN